MKYIISLIVENKHGVLAKIVQVITSRGYNIGTLSVGPSEQNNTSRMIITFDCDERTIQQIVKQMNKLIDVIKVFLITDDSKVERELVLIRVPNTKSTENSIFRIVDIFKGRCVHVTHKCYVLELTGSSQKIDAFIENIRPFGIQDLMRTGPLALPKFHLS